MLRHGWKDFPDLLIGNDLQGEQASRCQTAEILGSWGKGVLVVVQLCERQHIVDKPIPPGDLTLHGGDPLILAGRGETDPEKRIEIYRELEGVIYDVCSNLYICHPLDVVALNSKVEGFVANNDGYHQLENVMVRE